MRFFDHLGNRMDRTPWQRREKWAWRVPRSLMIFTTIVAFFTLTAAITQFDLTTQVKGILPTANGGTGQNSTATFPASGTVMTTSTSVACGQLPALTGDATTSAGACATTVAKVNGTSVTTNAAADQVLLTNASATGVWASVPNCTGALQYSTSTHTFSCGSVLTGTFSDNETPTGSCPTTTLTLAHVPSPAADLSLYYNGQLLVAGGADFTLSSSTITLVNSCPSGSVFRANYRY
jgi:hypothetical protein